MISLITFFASFLVRAIQQHLAGAQEFRAKQQEIMLLQLKINDVGTKSARKMFETNSLFGITASILAIMAFALILGVPLLAPLFTDIPVYFGWWKEGSEFLWFSSSSKLIFTQLPGIVLTPIHEHLLAAIAGLFFGSIRRNR